MASTSKFTRSRVAATATTLILAAAGCGSDDGDGDGAATRAALDVTETDFAIAPADARVDQSGDVRISVVNRGEAPHALAIETPDGVVKTKTLGAGESAELDAKLDDGTYEWFCPVGDHRARGMEGELKVGKGGDDAGAGGAGGSYGY